MRRDEGGDRQTYRQNVADTGENVKKNEKRGKERQRKRK